MPAFTLNEALVDLKNAIVEDGFYTEIFEDFSADYGFKAALLERKFEEKFNCPASEFRAVSPSEFRKKCVTYAKSLANAELEKYTGNSTVPAGLVFKRGAREYVTVGLVRQGLRCVNVGSSEITTIVWKNTNSMIAGLTNFGLL